MKPWELVHRGRLQAAGLWIDRALVPRDQAVRRILRLWQPGDTVHEAGEGWLVRFGRPRTLDATGLGLPLTEHQGELLGAPLRPEEWRERPAGALLQVRGGELLGVSLGARLQPADWLALDLPVAKVEACAPPPAPPRPALARDPVDRSTFGVEELAPEAREMLQDLVRSQPTSEASSSAGPGEGASAESLWDRLTAWWSGSDAPPASSSRARSTPSSAPPPPPAAAPAGPGFFDGLAALVGQWFPTDEQVRERRDANRLQRMLARFEDDLEEALRHAIPLAGEGGLHRTHPAWRRIRPRDVLSPGLAGAPGASPSMQAGPDLYERLRETYRRAAETLVEAGEIEKAAFVYTDLLGELTEALELLEEHGLYRLAARLAESREQDPARVARLYVLAGDLSRALRIANSERVFGLLVASFDGDDAVYLRAAYASHLLAQDRYAGAIQVLWDTRLRSVTRSWVERIVHRGGEGSGQALVQLEQLDADAADERLDLWLSEGLDARLLCELIEAMETAGGPKRWARRLVRRLWSFDGEPGVDQALQTLFAWGEVADLRADAPILQAVQRGSMRQVVRRDLAGGVPITDAVAVPEGTLCALGEGGLVLLDRRGREVWRDPTPCTWLVVDDEGFRLLGVHPAGPLRRVLRIDLRLRRVTLWLRTRLAAWSATSVAGQWLVHDGERPLAIDTSVRDASWRWIWQGPRLDAQVLLLAQDRLGAHIAVGAPVSERFSYDDAWFLQQRSPLRGHDGVAVNGRAFASWQGEQLFLGNQRVEQVDRIVALAAFPTGAWVATRVPEGIDVRSALSSATRALTLEGAGTVGLRSCGEQLGVFDDQGRVLWLDTPTWRTRGPWRIV